MSISSIDSAGLFKQQARRKPLASLLSTLIVCGEVWHGMCCGLQHEVLGAFLMDAEALTVENLATRSLAQRGLARASGSAFGFVHKGQMVEVSVERSVYRGHFISVHDGRQPPRQFRAIAGGYDWNVIAAYIKEVAERRASSPVSVAAANQLKEQNRQLADDLSTLTGAGPKSSLSIQPSPCAPGRVRVRVDEIDLDPASVLQLYAVVARALPPKSSS